MKEETFNINWMEVDKDSFKISSPFAIYPGEIKEKIHPNHCRTVELKALQAEIVYAINKFLCLTSKMLERYLKAKGMMVEQKTIQKEIAFMSDNCYLCKYQFKNPISGKYSAGKFYTIGRKGAGFIYSTTSQRANKVGYVEQCDPAQIKRLLASNQAMIAMIEIGNIKDSEVSVARMITDEGFHLLDNNYLFRASGCIENDRDITIIEPVRYQENFEGILLKKLKRMNKTLGCEKCNVDVSKKKRVIVLAESLLKMEQLMNIIDESKYDNIDAFEYSYDGLMYTDSENKLYRKSKDLRYVEPLIAI